MALPVFCQCLCNKLCLHLFFGLHPFEQLVFALKLFHTRHQRCVHAAELGAPFVKRSTAHAMLTAKFGYRNVGSLPASRYSGYSVISSCRISSSEFARKFYFSKASLVWGGYHFKRFKLEGCVSPYLTFDCSGHRLKCHGYG